MRTQPYRDKKFAQIERELAPELRRTGHHLVAIRRHSRRRPFTEVTKVANAVRKPKFVEPAAPIVNGVRMRWEKGRLVPRVGAKA